MTRHRHVRSRSGTGRADDTLKHLAALDPHIVQVIELRYFSGFGLEETA